MTLRIVRSRNRCVFVWQLPESVAVFGLLVWTDLSLTEITRWWRSLLLRQLRSNSSLLSSGIDNHQSWNEHLNISLYLESLFYKYVPKLSASDPYATLVLTQHFFYLRNITAVIILINMNNFINTAGYLIILNVLLCFKGFIHWMVI